MTSPFHLPPERARDARRATALLLHWLEGEEGHDGVVEIVQSVRKRDDVLELLFALLTVISVALEAAETVDQATEFLHRIVAQTALDEMGDGDG